MELNYFLTRHALILTEAALVEAIAHSTPDLLHPDLFNAVMVEHQRGRQVLTGLYRSFYDVARAFDLPFLITTPTWRASRDRIERAGATPSLNESAVAFLRDFIAGIKAKNRIALAGLMGCRHDCDRPEEGLDEADAHRFHAWQARRLSGADLLMAATLPAVKEARGMARAMGDTGLPYILSFVINRNGEVLDGTPLAEAVDMIDRTLPRRPLGYMVNCAHPSFLLAGEQPEGLFRRLIGFQANGSALDHDQLDRAPEPKVDDIKEWAAQMIRLNTAYGVKILGGCCGTRPDHLACIARGIVSGTAD